MTRLISCIITFTQAEAKNIRPCSHAGESPARISRSNCVCPCLSPSPVSHTKAARRCYRLLQTKEYLPKQKPETTRRPMNKYAINGTSSQEPARRIKSNSFRDHAVRGKRHWLHAERFRNVARAFHKKAPSTDIGSARLTDPSRKEKMSFRVVAIYGSAENGRAGNTSGRENPSPVEKDFVCL